MKRTIAIVVGLLLLGLIGWRIAGKLRAPEAASRRGGARAAVAVMTQPVRIEPIRDIRVFTGTVLPREQFVVAPKVAGRLEKLLVNLGDRVKNGDLIAVQDNQEYQQQLEQARAELEVAKANLADTRNALEVAEREFARAGELSKGKMISEAEMDQFQAQYHAAQAKHEVAQAQIRQQEAALKGDEVRLSYTRITASWENGGGERVVGERFVDQGAMLRANDPIVSVLDIDTVIVFLAVIERDYPLVLIGQTATVRTDAYPDRSFTGTIVRKAPLLKEASRQARVEIEVPNPERLLVPGLFVRAEIQFATQEKATVVPLAAVVRRDNRSGVFLADPAAMQARFIPVTLGIVAGETAEVVKPPLAGAVVTLGQHLLEDGAAILITEMKPESARGNQGGRP